MQMHEVSDKVQIDGWWCKKKIKYRRCISWGQRGPIQVVLLFEICCIMGTLSKKWKKLSTSKRKKDDLEQHTSQKGAFLDALQAHKYAVRVVFDISSSFAVAVNENFIGLKAVTLCCIYIYIYIFI